MPWKPIWEHRGTGRRPRHELPELVRLDGFDTTAGRISEDEWVRMVARASERLRLHAGARICEVGCGAGAFLYPMYRASVRRVYGIDYAASLLAISAALMPEGAFVVAEASHIPFRAGAFDAVVSNSVFQYFPSHAYAASTVREMIRVLRHDGAGLVLDINDEAKREAYETMRRASMPPGEYDRLHQDTPHLSFERAWWLRLGVECGVSVQLYNQDIPGYRNAPFRYNVLFEKTPRWQIR